MNLNNFKKLKNAYVSVMPLFIILGGFSGTVYGVNIAEKYAISIKHVDKPLHELDGVAIIIGGFSLGLLSGIVYPITGILGIKHLINNPVKELKKEK